MEVKMFATLQAINKWQRRAFSYGDSDCCQFTAFVVRELTGRDYAKAFSYNNETEAYALINAHGSLRDFAGSILGVESLSIKTGDPVLMCLPIIGEVMGVMLGDTIVSVTKAGLMRVDKRYLVCGWRG